MDEQVYEAPAIVHEGELQVYACGSDVTLEELLDCEL